VRAPTAQPVMSTHPETPAAVIAGPRQAPSPSPSTCPGCGALVLPGPRFCETCGCDLSVSSGAPGGAPRPTASCPRCGEAAQPGARFCGSCGGGLA
jgi:hypothetical protein